MVSKVYGVLKNMLSKRHVALVKYTTGDKAKIFDLISKVKKERQFLLRYPEAYNLYSIVRNTAKVGGDIAEVGTYNGASAKLISEIKGERKLFVFDSFEGLPETKDFDADHFHKGQFQSDYNVVKKYLSPYDNVFVYQGFFPQFNSEKVKDSKFSFIHLDVDLYDSTKACLEFFYSRMNKGGCIISHDYFAEGVYRAFDEFFKDKPEVLIELPEDQVLVIKL